MCFSKKDLTKINMWKFLSLLRSTCATWQMCLSYHNETYFTIGFYSQAEQTHHLHPLRQCKWGQSIISVKSVPVMLLAGKWERSFEKSRWTFPFKKEPKDDVQKMKNMETYLNWEQILCILWRQLYWRIQGKVSPIVKFGPYAEPCGWV